VIRGQGVEEIRLSVPGLPGVYLEDWLNGLRMAGSKEGQAVARWEFYGDNILGETGKISRLTPAVGSWVKHLAGCAQAMPLTSFLVAPDGVAEMVPLDQGCAEKWLNQILTDWESGLNHPLPVTARSALAFLSVIHADNAGSDADTLRNKAREAARKVYEGDGWHSSGELGYNHYLKRTYLDFNAVWQADGNRFQQLAESLYLPMQQHIRIMK
jgi:exodeoxyribonuclease V gamma subunit